MLYIIYWNYWLLRITCYSIKLIILVIFSALEGSGIEQEHCNLNVTPKRVILHSIAGPTYINNKLVAQDWELRQGDILQFGHFLKFRFHNPLEAAMLREKRRSGRFASFSDSGSGRVSPAVSLFFFLGGIFHFGINFTTALIGHHRSHFG